MLGLKFGRLIERHSEQLAKGLVQKLRTSERTYAFRAIPEHELEHDVHQLYQNLNDWLMTRTELDVQRHYTQVGMRRAQQGIELTQFVWALVLGKEHLWLFTQREAMADAALEILAEMEFMIALDQFFDRALYYAIAGYTQHQSARRAA